MSGYINGMTCPHCGKKIRYGRLHPVRCPHCWEKLEANLEAKMIRAVIES